MKPFWHSLSIVLFISLGFTKMDFIYFVIFLWSLFGLKELGQIDVCSR